MNVCDRMLIPPGGWQYTQPESGMRISGGSFRDLMQKILAHRRANSYPIGTHIEAEVEHSLCLQLSTDQRVQFCCEPNLPPLLNQAMSFGKTAGAAILGVAMGQGLAEAEAELARRLAFCHSCEFLNKQLERCSRCGCPVARKAWLRASSCPVGKW